MRTVFVSYRRGDSEGQARALNFELVKMIGKDSVFMDVDSIGLAARGESRWRFDQ